jgi:hypothetical protein
VAQPQRRARRQGAAAQRVAEAREQALAQRHVFDGGADGGHVASAPAAEDAALRAARDLTPGPVTHDFVFADRDVVHAHALAAGAEP